MYVAGVGSRKLTSKKLFATSVWRPTFGPCSWSVVPLASRNRRRSASGSCRFEGVRWFASNYLAGSDFGRVDLLGPVRRVAQTGAGRGLGRCRSGGVRWSASNCVVCLMRPTLLVEADFRPVVLECWFWWSAETDAGRGLAAAEEERSSCIRPLSWVSGMATREQK